MDFGTAAVTLAVAAVGFSGGFFSARWQAGTAREQWRRERLLEFCADLLAAGTELYDLGGVIRAGDDVPYPAEAARKLMHSYQCVHLLSRELSPTANRCATAYMAVIRDAYGHAGDAAQPAPNFDTASTNAGLFASDVNSVLLDVPPWWQFWSRRSHQIQG